MKSVLPALLMLLGAISSAWGGEVEIRRSLEPKLGGARIEAVVPTPIRGLYEVQIKGGAGTQILYANEDGSYVIQTGGGEPGHIIDVRAGENLTEARLRKLNAIAFSALPLDQAVKIRRGSGKRVMAMFSDPYCPACRQFERELAKVDDVTVYVFMYPVIRPANKDHSKAVWCSADRARAWLDLAAAPSPKVPDASPKCANPVDRVLALGQALGVNSTPTVYLSTGEKVSGMLPAAQLEHLLDEAAGKPRN